MIDEKIKSAYESLVPSEECRQRILEKISSDGKAEEFRMRIKRLSCIGYAAAACILVSVVALFMATSGKSGVYYNGDLVATEGITVNAESVEYVTSGVKIARYDVSDSEKTAKGAVTLELYEKNAAVTVTGGNILVYDEELESYVDVGQTLDITGKTKIVWALPESTDEIYELTVENDDKLYTLTASYDKVLHTISLKTK